MKPSVLQSLLARALVAAKDPAGTAAAILEAINHEIRPVLAAVRDVVNFEAAFKAVVTTADSPGVAKKLWESERVPENGVWRLKIDVVGASPSVYLAHERVESWRIASGSATELIKTTIHSFESGISAPTLTFDATTGTFSLSGTDDGSGAVVWVVLVRVLEVVL